MGVPRWMLVAVAAALILGGGGIASSWVYETQRKDLVEAARGDLARASAAFVQALTGVFEPALTLAGTVTDSGIRHVRPEERPALFFAVATGVVRQFEQINGAFLGFPDGSFLHVQDLDPSGLQAEGNPLYRRVIDRPESDPVGTWEVYYPGFDAGFPTTRQSPPYDPRERPWYAAAVAAEAPVWTEIYTFASSGALGVTYAQPIYTTDGALWAVLGVDLSLGALSHTLVDTAQALAWATEIVFATDFGDRVVGHPDFVALEEEFERDTAAFLERYRRAGSFEAVAVRSLKDGAAVQMLAADGREFLATRAELDPARAMPMQLYLAREMDAILASAVSVMIRNVALVFAAFVIFGLVCVYALKLRIEVTARQRAEAELIEARDAAEAATRSKSVFLATMSHEIRTPMNGVMSMAELLGLTKLDGEQRRMAKIISDSATALLTIINDILDFSKIEAGRLEIERVGFSLAEAVDGCAALLAPRAEAKGLDLLVEIDPDLVDARTGDPTRLRQILLNLGGNAIKFTETGCVAIRVGAAAPGRLRIAVEDTGIGLSEEQQARLFQAFVQADSSTSRKYGGTGLGLSICQRLSDLMGGAIGVDSAPGEGSTFWVELPLAAAGDAPPRPVEDLSAATIALVGLSDPVAQIATRYLLAGGVGTVDRLADVGAAKDAGPRTLWLVDAAAAAAGLPPLDGQLGGQLDGKLALIGTRAAVADLDPDLRVRAAAVLTYPVTRAALWRAVEIGLGLRTGDEVEAETRADMAFAPPEVEAARAAGALVLVAEDDLANRLVITKMLGHLGFACELAENGREALEMWQGRPGYGLLLTDFNMPEMDGFELTRAVRAAEAEDRGSRLPIVALTADAMSGTEQACLDAGMDGYLTKPVDSRKLGAALADHLPAALELRRPAGEGSVETPEQETPAPAAGFDWDPDIFDPAALVTTFGGFDAEAKMLVADAATSWRERVEAIAAALTAEDAEAARREAHTLKGSALSVGAKRLGTIASDIQDALDAGDAEMAGILAEVLAPTLEEFEDVKPKVLAL